MFNKLNDQQLAMVRAEGNLIVSACPGSGKTRALTYKIAHELERIEHTKKHVVALTYTNRAADEIQSRIESMNIDTGMLWTGTIHAFCLEWILRPYSGYSDRLKHGFTVIDEYRQERILEKIKQSYGLSPKTDVSTKWERTGRRTSSTEVQQRAADEYENELRKNKWIDFDHILFLSYTLVNDIPQIAATLSRLFATICVDEYQDTSDLQYGIIGSIIKAGQGRTNVVCVGDPDQAVYETLGGYAKTAEEMSQEIGGYPVKSITLSGNYRSTQRIIDYYRHFQMTNIDITALGANASSESIITFNNRIYKGSLAEEIARLIQCSLDSGILQNQICVIAPQWWMLISMARTLKTLLPEVCFDAPGLSPLPKRPENFWFKVARLFLTESSPRLYLARIRWANQVIQELSVFIDSNVVLNGGTELNSRRLLKIVNSIRLSASQTKGALAYLKECFQHLSDQLGVIIHDYLQLVDHYNAFFEGIQSRLSKPEFSGMDNDIDNFRSVFKQSTGVVVNTCQGVKGEEYQTVIAYGLIQGYVPHYSVQPQLAVAVSKRLLYVICSRAKTNLHLIAELGRKNPTNRELSTVDFDYDVL